MCMFPLAKGGLYLVEFNILAPIPEWLSLLVDVELHVGTCMISSKICSLISGYANMTGHPTEDDVFAFVSCPHIRQNDLLEQMILEMMILQW